jgi:hypothetical protein
MSGARRESHDPEAFGFGEVSGRLQAAKDYEKGIDFRIKMRRGPGCAACAACGSAGW